MGQFAIGQPVPRTEDPRLLTGNGRFTDDVSFPNQAYAVFLRSPYAHADIRSIDTDAARSMPGVLAVLTGEEYAADGLGDILGPSPRQRRDGSPMYRPPRPALTRDRVRHVGQSVALVIAETVGQAKDAAEQIVVDYASLPAVLPTETANQPGSEAIWEDCPDNEAFFFEAGDGDAVETALAEAPHVIRQKFIISRVSANTIEPRGAVARYDAGEDRYTIHVGHQRPYAWRAAITKNILKIAENKLSLITGDVGGSFGMKGSIYPEYPLVAWASKKVARPVKWICERSEGFISDDHGRDNVSEAELALDEDGRFLGLRVTTNANMGAYVSFLGIGPPVLNVGSLAGVYTIPAIHSRVAGVMTNTNPTSPYRGAGRPEATYIIERMIHIAAAELDLDPTELRRRNFIPPEAMPYKTALTFTYDSGEFEALMDKGLTTSEYGSFEGRRQAAAVEGKLRGIGVSCSIEQAAAPQPETAEMRFDPSGTLTLLVGSAPHGQGHETIYKQLVCEKLGLEPGDIRVIEGDTDKLAFGTGTGGSRTATIGTSAVLEAVNKTVAKGRQIAAHLLEAVENEEIVFEDGRFAVKGTNRVMPFADMVAAAFNSAKLPPDLEPGLAEVAHYSPKKSNFPNGCHVCEVEIDPATGTVEIVDYTAFSDVGTELNPLLVKGQVLGGIAQGAGQALMEHLIHDEVTGQVLTGSFMDYGMPRARNFCEVKTGSHPVPTPTNPLGVKGAGECGTVGSLAAVMNAVNDALAPLGIRHLEMPLTPERVWRAIEGAAGP
ncbi:MAG: xanthine dehydrogenase family protein molybdopterin-binding subunit [Rhodospirillales bacterium]|nr:xanthine dehydrogenase family protein molybdopterin-binding subunit [Rhodospirillales bacterium]